MRINKDGKTYEIIDSIEDAKPGDRLDKLGWEKDGCFWVIRHGWSAQHHVVEAILAAGLDRIIREVPEAQVWRGRVAPGDCHMMWDGPPPAPTVGYLELKAWPQGTPEPLPENVGKFLKNASNNVHHATRAGELCKEYGL